MALLPGTPKVSHVVMTTTETSKWATLRNGRRVIIRPIHSTDAAALVAFDQNMDDDEVIALTQVDHVDREVLVALSLSTIVGVGRLDRTGNSDPPMTVTVVDGWHGLGLATHLRDRLGVQPAMSSASPRLWRAKPTSAIPGPPLLSGSADADPPASTFTVAATELTSALRS